ncbi:MAG: 4Fe-4S dicluster domain-containing protein, partial [Opitutales bacterium]
GGDQQEAGGAFSATHLEVRFTRDNLVDDGRFINNGWLQECPDPITKLTWDNAILISPKLADEIGILPGKPFIAVARQANPNRIKMGRMIAPVAEVELAGRTVRAPLHIQPGLADYTIVLPLGYGQTQAGRIGQGVGFDFYGLRTSDAFHFAQGATLRVTGETVQLANAQEHWSMEGRAIIREGNKDYYDSNPAFVDGMGMESHTPPNFGHDRDLPLERKVTETPRGTSLYETPEFPGIHQWGMSIDLNTCIGCNACVVACQSENNIPIVGKDQVLRGREMHWMRIDRYYSTGAIENTEHGDDPQVTLQPMLCQHCDNAPCEFVCPVNATVQDDEGLNIMAYNRCVGTRYCANNCPYKVRRFNFFDWNHQQEEHYYKGPFAPKGMEELHKMQKNPDVTVRMRGVMEKCTFCTQRIEAAKIDQKVKAGDSPDVNIPDGAIQTACQQACPTESIMFGNLADTESEVYRWKHRDQDYSVLGYLNTRPRVTYLAKLRNPNPSMPDYLTQPLSTVEYYRKNYPNRDSNAGGGAEQ